MKTLLNKDIQHIIYIIIYTVITNGYVYQYLVMAYALLLFCNKLIMRGILFKTLLVFAFIMKILS